MPARQARGKFINPVDTQVGGPGMLWRVLRLYLANKEERVPRRALGPFATNTAIYQQAPSTGLRITWMGHSSMLLELDGLRILIDPMWDKRASPVSFAGPRRFFPATLALKDLPPLDAVLISHNHYDHLGASTVRQLAQLISPDALWITSLGVGKQLRRLGVVNTIKELNWTEAVLLRGVAITALPARHFSGRGILDRFRTLWSSFALRGPRHNVYYGADSGRWDGFAEIARQYGPFDLTMLEIGAYHELWKSIHMGPDGAARVFQEMGSLGLLMPVHWGLFDLALHSWRQPVERITELAQVQSIKLWSPEPGVPTEVTAGQEHRSNWWRNS